MGQARFLRSALRGSAAAGAIAAGIAFFGTTALAQEGEETFTEEAGRNVTILERIVVGAGNEKVAIDTPQAVTVVNQEEIDQEQAATVGEVMDFVPGAQAIGSDRVMGQSFNIRGIGSFTAADESKIIVNVDGATKFHEQYRLGSLFTDPELYKQIEILRGPASSTLYGSGALGGVINLVTKDASDFLDEGQNGVLRLKGGYNSNPDGWLGSAILALRLTDNTDLLVQGNYRDYDNFSNGDSTEILGSEFETWSGLIKTTTRFGYNHEQELRLSYQRWNNDQPNANYEQTGQSSPFPPMFPFIGAANPFGFIDRNTTDETAVISYKNPDSMNPWVDFNLNLSWSRTQIIQQDWMPGEPILAGDPLFEDAEYGNQSWQAKADNTFEYIGGNFENYLTVGGAFALQDRVATTETTGSLEFHPEGRETEYGVFAQNEWIYNDVFTVIAGIRADFAFLEPDPTLAGAQDSDYTAISPKIAAHYKLTENLAVFGSIAGTERAPTIDELYTTCASPGRQCPVASSTTSPNLVPESAANYEAGFTLSLYDKLTPGDSFQLKTTAFRNDIDDLIARNPMPAIPGPHYVNIDQALIEGVEIEAAYEAEYGFGRLAYSLVRGIDATTGAPLDTIPAENLVVSLGGYVPDYGLKYGWKGAYFADAPNGANGPADGYDVHDFFLAWIPDMPELRGFELHASVENAFNEQFRNNLDNEDGMGRTFKISLVKELGW